MAIELPSPEKIHTTTYDNFKGVDYTNDPSNVWRRRSPSGVNMLPDASGRPFKRCGWETVITSNDLLAILGTDETNIYRCFYFELGGEDHIIIFAYGGVFIYTQNSLSMLSGSDDVDCYSSYDRAFFFEGNGVSAFYIYGNYKVWRYGIDGFNEVEPDIPTIMITASADGVGEMYEAYNMLSNKANIEYQNNDLFYMYVDSDSVFDIDPTTFKTKVSNTRGTYNFKYVTDHWELNNTTVTLAQYGITNQIGSPENNDEIIVVFQWGVLLPTNVAQTQLDDVRVFATKVTQFDDEYTVLEEITGGTPNVPSAHQVVLHTDGVSHSNKKAWIEFSSEETPSPDMLDIIRVTMPVTEVNISSHESTGSGQAEINGRVV